MQDQGTETDIEPQLWETVPRLPHIRRVATTLEVPSSKGIATRSAWIQRSPKRGNPNNTKVIMPTAPRIRLDTILEAVG